MFPRLTPSPGPGPRSSDPLGWSRGDRELTDSALYYAREANAELGLAFIATFERALDLLCSNPQLGASWRNERRRFPLPRFPYSIIYYIQGEELRVIAIAHHARKPGYWGGRK